MNDGFLKNIDRILKNIKASDKVYIDKISKCLNLTFNDLLAY